MPTLPISILNQFPEFPDRQAYEAATGSQAPIFDPTQPIKKWFDPAGAGTYRVFNGDNSHPGFETLSMTSDLARKVNLTGAPHYPPYVVAPTGVVSVFKLGAYESRTPISAYQLTLKEEADTIAAAMGGTVSEQATNLFRYEYPPNEPRRVYTITVNGNQFNAGAVMADMNKAGVGAPGHFEGATWVVDRIPDGNDGKPHPTMAVPVRDLQPDESLVVIQTNLGILGVQDTAMVQVGAPDPTTGTTDASIAELLRKVDFIYKAVGGQ